MQTLTLGYSPCPNDTYIFHGLVHGLVSNGRFTFHERLEDVETLNALAREGLLDISKVSCHLLGFIRADYCLLRSGGALGWGCGPLVVSRNCSTMAELAGRRIAVPGRYTTAYLLLQLYGLPFGEVVFLPFDEILSAVAQGKVDGGVIIHESRFTYVAHGLCRVMDLGQWWEGKTGQPVPLGGIVARRSLGLQVITEVEQAIRASIAFARSNPTAAHEYIRAHSQEMSADVCAAHIDLYVNEFSLDLGRQGEVAVRTLLEEGEKHGLFPSGADDLFLTPP